MFSAPKEDCLAGQLLVQEAGGMVEAQNADEMLVDGGRVVVATPAIFDKMVTMADETFGKQFIEQGSN